LGSRNASFHERGIGGVLLAPVKFAAAIVLTLLGLLLVAWVVDAVMVRHVWPEGLVRLEAVLACDLERAGQVAGQCETWAGLPGRAASLLYGLVFEVTGLHEIGARFADGAPLSVPDTIVRRTYVEHFGAIRIAMVGTQLFGVRLAMLVTALPLVWLLYAVALVDGLTQRAIRRASGGRESASLYHRAKHLQVVVFALGVAATLVWPGPVSPSWVWIPIAVVTAGLARVQWSFNKTHV
jgi:integrating conjugative element membrane protein (TIGR03747 family)